MLRGKKIYMKPLEISDAESNLRLQLDNRQFFETYSMTRGSEYYTIDNQLKQINSHIENRKTDDSYHFGIFRFEDDELVGTINLFQVVRGDSQSAFIGYFLDKKNNGKGYATEAVNLIVSFGFNEIDLHRIEAGVMPHNLASIRVLEKAGFRKEGIAIKNVRINGIWEDHQVLAIINPND